jgi:mono/diheme cytochrome c family protein
MKQILARKGFVGRTFICAAVVLILAAVLVPDGPAAARTVGSGHALGAAAPPTPTAAHPGSAGAVLPPTPPSSLTGMQSKRSILLPPLPASATQADRGAAVYMLVCSACHGDKGQGLTDAWRATWAPEDQNCWQTKCHAPSHPPDGFEIPRYVPPAVGPAVRARFQTALGLHDYVQSTMPWHEPGSIVDDQYWDITAFMLRMMGLDQGNVPLDRQRAAQISLIPVQGEVIIAPTSLPSSVPARPSPTEAPASPAGAGRSLSAWLVVPLLAVAGAAAGIFLLIRSQHHS